MFVHVVCGLLTHSLSLSLFVSLSLFLFLSKQFPFRYEYMCIYTYAYVYLYTCINRNMYIVSSHVTSYLPSWRPPLGLWTMVMDLWTFGVPKGSKYQSSSHIVGKWAPKHILYYCLEPLNFDVEAQHWSWKVGNPGIPKHSGLRCHGCVPMSCVTEHWYFHEPSRRQAVLVSRHP